jgi:hypothetical protein
MCVAGVGVGAGAPFRPDARPARSRTPPGHLRALVRDPRRLPRRVRSPGTAGGLILATFRSHASTAIACSSVSLGIGHRRRHPRICSRAAVAGCRLASLIEGTSDEVFAHRHPTLRTGLGGAWLRPETAIRGRASPRSPGARPSPIVRWRAERPVGSPGALTRMPRIAYLPLIPAPSRRTQGRPLAGDSCPGCCW